MPNDDITTAKHTECSDSIIDLLDQYDFSLAEKVGILEVVKSCIIDVIVDDDDDETQ